MSFALGTASDTLSSHPLDNHPAPHVEISGVRGGLDSYVDAYHFSYLRDDKVSKAFECQLLSADTPVFEKLGRQTLEFVLATSLCVGCETSP